MRQRSVQSPHTRRQTTTATSTMEMAALTATAASHDPDAKTPIPSPAPWTVTNRPAATNPIPYARNRKNALTVSASGNVVNAADRTPPKRATSTTDATAAGKSADAVRSGREARGSTSQATTGNNAAVMAPHTAVAP